MSVNKDQLLLDLWLEKMKRDILDLFGETEDYRYILKAVDEDRPLYGGDITIKRKTRLGTISMVTYHIAVMDDLGNVLHGVQDVGGRCSVHGEIVHKDYLYDCERCHKKFCYPHIRFAESEEGKIQLCCWGEREEMGCFYRYEHWWWDPFRFIKRRREKLRQVRTLISEETAIINEKIRKRQAELQLKYVKEMLKRPIPERPAQPALPPRQPKMIEPASVRCPNCGFNPWKGHDAVCPECHASYTTKDGVTCPECGHPLDQITCFRCGTRFEV